MKRRQYGVGYAVKRLGSRSRPKPPTIDFTAALRGVAETARLVGKAFEVISDAGRILVRAYSGAHAAVVRTQQWKDDTTMQLCLVTGMSWDQWRPVIENIAAAPDRDVRFMILLQQACQGATFEIVAPHIVKVTQP